MIHISIGRYDEDIPTDLGRPSKQDARGRRGRLAPGLLGVTRKLQGPAQARGAARRRLLQYCYSNLLFRPRYYRPRERYYRPTILLPVLLPTTTASYRRFAVVVTVVGTVLPRQRYYHPDYGITALPARRIGLFSPCTPSLPPSL